MKYEVRLASKFAKEKTILIELERNGAGWRVSVEGRPLAADVAEIAPYTLSILLEGQSFEVSVTPSSDGKLVLQTGAQEFTAEVIDPRTWSGRLHGGAEAEGRQQIQAPMPGKVVRVLVKEGNHVEAGQGLLVVEAMKMQNEIRSPKSGTVERVLVHEGQAVNAGDALAVVS
jgi:biotin carboxyl carrier protein